MIRYFNRVIETISNTLNKCPMASFAVTAFLFIILRLYNSMEPLLVIVLFSGLGLILLNFKKRINNFITIFLMSSMLLGVFSASLAIDRNNLIADRFNGEMVKIEGRVSSIPTKSDTFFLETKEVISNKGVFNDNFKIYMSTDIPHKLTYGDTILVNCNLYRSDAVNSDLSNYYLAKGAPLKANNVNVLSIKDSSAQGEIITNIRNHIIDLGKKHLSGDAESLFLALTAGDRSTFSDELTENLSKSGLSHIACVSGLHVSILGMAVYNLLKKKKRILAALLSFAVVYMFAFVTGASPSTMRAAIMFTCFLIAKISLNENHSFTALSVSAMILAIINPYVIFDWGFILSFMSVLGIEIFSPFFKSLLKFCPEILADSISATVSAQLMTIPVTTNMFGYLPLYSVFANILVSVIFVYALYFCFIFIPLSYIPFIDHIAKVLCTFLLESIAAVACFFANLPNSMIFIDSFDIYELICYYTIALLFVFRKNISAYFIGTVFILCSIMLAVTAILPDAYVKKYELRDHSVVYVSEEKTVLDVKTSMLIASDALKNWDRYADIDYVIINGFVRNQENGLIELNHKRDIAAIYIPKGNGDKTFISIANKMGIETKEYTIDEKEKLIEDLI